MKSRKCCSGVLRVGMLVPALVVPSCTPIPLSTETIEPEDAGTLDAADGAPNRPATPAAMEIAAGATYSGAMVNGTVYTWGSNRNGELGRAGTGPTPVAISLGDERGERATSLAFGSTGGRPIALDARGQIWEWGGGAGSLPTKVGGIAGAVHVAAGSGHRLILAADGTLHASGANGAGQLGLGTTATGVDPKPITGIRDVKSACAGANHSVAITGDGAVWAWGANDVGQLGQGAIDAAPHPSPGVVELLKNAIRISCGRNHTLARLADGSVWAWGGGASGQLGHGESGNLANRPQPTRVSGLPEIDEVMASANSSWAIDEQGRLWAWGQNSSGQLGVGTSNEKRVPAPAFGLGPVVSVAGGGEHTLFRTRDGRTWASGSNASEQLGRAGGSSLVPIEVTLP